MNNSKLGSASLIINVALIVALILLLRMYFGEKDSRIEQQTLIEASTAELQKLKNEAGQNLAKIQVLETANAKTFLAFESQNETIKELQQLVKENRRLFKDSKGTAGIIKSETKIDTTTATTVTQDSLNNPIYTSKIKEKWFNIDVEASIDSTSISLRSYHSLSLVMGSESQGLFKKRKTFAIAKDENPYSDIKDMRIYNVSEDKNRFVVGPYVGIGVTNNQGVVRTGWQVGLGVTLKLIEF